MYILSISESILLFICGIGILQGFLLSVLIYFHPKSDQRVNKFLACYIASISIIMSGPLLLQVVSWKDTFVIGSFPSLVGPLLYFYIRSFKEKITLPNALPHLVIFFAYSVFTYWFVRDLAIKYPGAKDFPNEGFNSIAGFFYFGLRYAQMIVYYFIARHELKSYQKAIQHVFSETSQIDLRWVKLLVNGYIIIILSALIIYFFLAKYPEYFYQLYLLNIAIATPYIYLATYKGITQPTIWQKLAIGDKEKLEEQLHKTGEVTKAYPKQQAVKQGLNNSRTEEIIAKVIEEMDKGKLYREPELTLQDLSSKLKFPSYQVSTAINEGMKKSFYDLVNGYRVEEAKRLLANPKNRDFTILSVGFEAGFNSKTTFNTVFKKFTGLTPTRFRDNQSVPALEA